MNCFRVSLHLRAMRSKKSADVKLVGARGEDTENIVWRTQNSLTLTQNIIFFFLALWAQQHSKDKPPTISVIIEAEDTELCVLSVFLCDVQLQQPCPNPPRCCLTAWTPRPLFGVAQRYVRHAFPSLELLIHSRRCHNSFFFFLVSDRSAARCTMRVPPAPSTRAGGSFFPVLSRLDSLDSKYLDTEGW